ncbi:MAG: IPT/TIG domain-containing protein [Terriglobales bacterium]
MRICLLASLMAMCVACGGGGSPAAIPQIENPVPAVASASLAASNSADVSGFILAVNGTNFVSGSVVNWNGSPRPTTYVNATQVKAQISAMDLGVGAVAQITTTNPSPGGGTSAAFSLAVSNLPAITSLSPQAATVGGGALVVAVSGFNFQDEALVLFNGASRSTAFVSSTQLTVSILAADLVRGTLANVIVQNRGTGGGVSNIVLFAVNNSLPVLTSLSPATSFAAGGSFVLQASGSGFVQGATLNWNGTPLQTMFGDAGTISANVPAMDVASVGTAHISVTNPSPGGGASNILSYGIAPSGGAGPEMHLIATSGSPFPGSADAISADGTYVAFAASGTDITPNEFTDGHSQIYLHDTCTNGPPGCTPSNLLVSLSPSGGLTGVDNTRPQLSSDGRFVGWVEEIGGLTPGDHAFVRDTCIGGPVGCVPVTVEVSLDANGQPLGLVADVRLSGNGRYALVRWGQPFHSQILWYLALRDTCLGVLSGCTPSTQSVITDANGIDMRAALGSIDATARHLAFQIFNQFGELDAFVKDTCIGAAPPCTSSTQLVSVDPSGMQLLTNDLTVNDMSPSGRFVVMTVRQAAAPQDSNGLPRADVLLRDLCIDAPIDCVPTTIPVSVSTSGLPGNDDSYRGSVSSDGRFVVFHSNASNLVAGDSNNLEDVFLRDTCNGVLSGCQPSTARITTNAQGVQANAGGDAGVISADGTMMVFSTFSSNLVAGTVQGTYSYVWAKIH